MEQPNSLLLQQVFAGIEFPSEDLDQLQGMLVISQTKAAVELLLGLSVRHKELLADLAELLQKHHTDLSAEHKQQYEYAMTNQAVDSIAKIVELIRPHLSESEQEIVHKNLAAIVAQN